MAQASNYSAIMSALAALLTAAGCVNVHAYQRLAQDWATFLARFKDVSTTPDCARGWTISRKSSAETRSTSLQNERIHTLTIRGIRSLDDSVASEVQFQAEIETVCNKLRETYNLTATCELADPPQVVIVDVRNFGGVLCHYCEIEIKAQELLLGG